MDESVILELVGKAYEAAYDRSQWPAYLESLRARTGSAGACFVSSDPTGDDAHVTLMEGPRVSSEFDRKYQEYYHKIDEYAHAYQRSGFGPGQVWGSHQVISDAAMAASEFYDGLLRPVDIFYCAGGILFQEGPLLIGICAWRSRRQGPADDETLRLLAALMPHQQHAVRIEGRLRQLEAARRFTGGLVDGLPYGLIALDRRGRVLAMNRMAEDIAGERDGLCLGPDGLSGLRPRDDQVLQRAIAGALAAAPAGSTVELPRPSSLQPLRLILTPVPRGQKLGALDDLTPAALVFIHDPERRGPVPVAVLRRLYDLSPQQARLSALLADGTSLAEAAERLGVAGATAASHLKQVFRKTGVRRQVDLIRLLLSLPPDSGNA